MAMLEIRPEEWNESAFEVIGQQWMLIGCEAGGRVNAMTASWGGFGVLWNRPVIYLWVRPERYTHLLLEEAHQFSVNILPGDMGECYRICGAVSGRDTDKIARCALAVEHHTGIPFFSESRVSALCRLAYQQPMTAGGYCDFGFLENTLQKGNLHTLFIGEIVALLQNEKSSE